MRSGIIALLTDFGSGSPFAGIVKGVALGINPAANMVDLQHDIKPQDVVGAAFCLSACIDWFPAGTVFMAVVDPGVGTKRRCIAVQGERHFYVGPDNGIFSLAFKRDRPVGVVELRPGQWTLERVCRTFHGRDIFAPAAAYLSKGVPLEHLGSVVTGLTELSFEANRFHGDSAQTTVIDADSFGNVITLLHLDELEGAGVKSVKVGGRLIPFRHTFAEVPEGELLAYWGSSDYLEIAVNAGSAREALGLKRGDDIEVVLENGED